MLTHRAVISIGTNTCRVLIIAVDEAGTVTTVHHDQRGTRLGAGLGEGDALDPIAVDRTIDAVDAFLPAVRNSGAELSVIATSAVRRAVDADEFAARVRALTGVPLRTLSGDEEAAASFRGAVSGRDVDGARIAVVDVGGGSTECAVGRDGRLDGVVSVEIGAVRISERFSALLGGSPGDGARLAARAARAFARDRLARVAALRPVDRALCVAGTPLTVVAIARSSHVEHVSGLPLSGTDLESVIERLCDLDLAQRRALPGMLPIRADVVLGGAIILREALRHLGDPPAHVEVNDLLLGYLLSAGDKESKPIEA